MKVDTDGSDKPQIIAGRNPVIEAIRAGTEIEKILISDTAEGSVKRIEAMAAERNIRLDRIGRSALDRILREADLASMRHQGVIAYAENFAYCELDDILEAAEQKGEPPFVIVLDGIEDPHNLGAIIRTAECCGAHGVVITSRRSAAVNATAARSAAGAEQHMNVARVTNLGRAIDELKARGVWVAACDMNGSICYEADLKGGIALVIGSEGRGIGRLVREKCDFAVSIPMFGNINSLNASNAAAILMYEVRRQRGSV